MYKVTITLNNEHHISNTVQYFWADDACEQLNKARRDAFVPVAGMLVQPEDVSCILVEEINEGRRSCGVDTDNCASSASVNSGNGGGDSIGE